MTIFLKSEFRKSQEAATEIVKIIQKEPSLLDPYFTILLSKLNSSVFFKRNVLRFIEKVDFDPKFEGELYSNCRSYLLEDEAIAIKAFSMEICRKIAERHPDLKPELKEIIQYNIERYPDSGGIKSRGNKVLNLL